MITVSVWYTYVDWTTEVIPRPFYVGKGNLARIQDFTSRNIVWHRISAKFGCRREIVFETTDEEASFKREQELILELKTFIKLPGGWGANLCLGGPGPTGCKWSTQAKKKLAASVKSLWEDPEYRCKLMAQPPVSAAELERDGAAMCWDDIAAKYDVSATTVKRWFRENGVLKARVRQTRQSWDEASVNKLWKLYQDGKLVRDIARELGRSECSIKKRIQKLCNDFGVERHRYRREK